MTNPIAGSGRSIPSVQTILQHMAMPLLLFAMVLFTLLFVSWSVLLPLFTSLHTSNGVALSPEEIEAEERRLTAQIASMENERITLILPIDNEQFDQLKAQKVSRMSLTELEEQLHAAAARVGEGEDVIALEKLSILGDSVEAKGMVKNVGARSMTVLAAFVEELEELPFVLDLKRPAFSRSESEEGYFSPFAFVFRLAQ